MRNSRIFQDIALRNICIRLSFLSGVTNVVTAWKVSKYGVFSCPYFPVFGLNTGKCGPEQTPHLDTFHVVCWETPKYSAVHSTDDF